MTSSRSDMDPGASIPQQPRRYSPNFPLSPPFPSSSLPWSFPSLPSIPLLREAVPLKPARVLGSAISSPSGVWGEAPADVDFGVF